MTMHMISTLLLFCFLFVSTLFYTSLCSSARLTRLTGLAAGLVTRDCRRDPADRTGLRTSQSSGRRAAKNLCRRITKQAGRWPAWTGKESRGEQWMSSTGLGAERGGGGVGGDGDGGEDHHCAHLFAGKL